MQQQQQIGNPTLSKVDVHVLHMPDEINIVGDLDDPRVVVHHLAGIDHNVLQARVNGFSLGEQPYVSFVDPDDEVDIAAFGQCADVLDANPHLCGVYTNSTVVHFRDDVPRRKKYRPHKWSLHWHRTDSSPVHQLAVMRRSIFDQIVDRIEIPPADEVFAEHLIYAHAATIAPWKFIDIDAYTWYARQTGAHVHLTGDKRRKSSELIKRVLDSVEWDGHTD